MCKVIAIANQKGGVGKTTTTISLGIGLARKGKKVLLIDADAQGSLTAALGIEPNGLSYTLANIMADIINAESCNHEKALIHHQEAVDLIPANIELSALEVSLVGVMFSREYILKTFVDSVRELYDYILIDCMPSLGMITINALTCADSVLIPVQAAYLPMKGLQQLMNTIMRVKKGLNKSLQLEGILLTMVDIRTNYAKNIEKLVREHYKDINIFTNNIPVSVRAGESSATGGSIYEYDPDGKVSIAYQKLTEEVLSDSEKGGI